ncbi:hypothetical protein Amet_0078 [Alkaliphilus metalliredigens QYMF]|uniref:Uncharacterized protein n=1 Tax=Alkaliphilus metalliredigens (strain QYMF) TaxID=293826 RepID=A6TJF3_ALKMQ|nr:hypothetical protein [Alkaliphilus metalliredigens]ABR46321.1 hypothetical protein Amet_0078 [Alkaliphilus metalliredigens QYMF]
MAAMIRHTASEPKKPFWQTMLKIIGALLVINLFVELTNFMPKNYASIASVMILLISTGLTSYLINRNLAKYTYILIEDDLIFYKEIGSKEKKVLDVKIYDIQWIKPIQALDKQEKCNKTYGIACRLKGKGVYVGQYENDGKINRFIFQPSEGLLEELQKQITVANQ